MTTYAIVLPADPRTLKSILMILDDRKEAEDIAFTLRQRGQDIEDVEMGDPAPEEYAEAIVKITAWPVSFLKVLRPAPQEGQLVLERLAVAHDLRYVLLGDP